MLKELKFIDIFSGIGGFRIAFEESARNLGFTTKCVFHSEIKKHAIEVYKENFKECNNLGDITNVNLDNVENFDILLAGFPCQPFSQAGLGKGFKDKRGGMFFEIERILKAKQPKGFILENVKGLLLHNRKNKKDTFGATFEELINRLQTLGYKITWELINSAHHGTAQNRERVYIVGTLDTKADINLFHLHTKEKTVNDILEKNKETLDTYFTKQLLKNYAPQDLIGKSIKDKRGGSNNIHSWDIGLKGQVTSDDKVFLSTLLKIRRHKRWAEELGIKWSDGMPLTECQIREYYSPKNLKSQLSSLTKLGYIALEYPKETVNGIRILRTDLEKGYTIKTGKLSFPIHTILDPNSQTQTLVASDSSKIAVIDNNKIRYLTVREGLRLFGFPECYKINQSRNKAFDLLGNTVSVPVIKFIAHNLLSAMNF